MVKMPGPSFIKNKLFILFSSIKADLTLPYSENNPIIFLSPGGRGLGVRGNITCPPPPQSSPIRDCVVIKGRGKI
jgi:hypothetical protein